MDLRPTPDEERLRSALRAWLEVEVPRHGPAPAAHDYAARRAYDTAWQAKLFAAGYAGMEWPEEYGGRDATPGEALVYYEETARAKAPYIGVNFIGLRHGGPTLIAEGTPEQKARHLPKILAGEEIWCQGFSEPTAGSDLASLRTRAERDGDHYVVNGHKIWTTHAQAADQCEMLVRTGSPDSKHKGISWLIVDMRSPGIDVRPIPTLGGESEFAECFLENVRVPVGNRVGAENDGWRVTQVTLQFERGTAWVGHVIAQHAFLAELVAVARRVTRWDATAWDDAALRRELGVVQAELDGLWAMLRMGVSEISQTGVQGAGASAVKLLYTEIDQHLGDLAIRVLGRAGSTRDDFEGLPNAALLWSALRSLNLTISGGSSQIQRNIIAERILGLPREPR